MLKRHLQYLLTIAFAFVTVAGLYPISAVSASEDIVRPRIVPAQQSNIPVPGQYTEALVGQIRKLNPLFASYNPVDRDITALIFEGLTTVNEYGEVIPDLAERWEVSRDGLEYIFALRRDVLWQDGLPFTSADVRFTINLMRDSAFPGDPALTEFWRTIEMAVIDDYTIRFRLVQPLAPFPEHLRFGILPEHALRGYPAGDLDTHLFNLTPIGTGPYQMESLLSDGNGGIGGIVLRVAPVFRQRPEGQEGYFIDRLIFRTYPTVDEALAAYAQGEVNGVSQVSPERMSELATLPNSAINTTPLPAVGVLIYNWQRPEIGYMADQRVRLAFAHAIDRSSAVLRAMGGMVLPAESPLVPLSWAYNPEASYPALDLQYAQSLLENISFETEVEVEDDEEEGGAEDEVAAGEEDNGETEEATASEENGNGEGGDEARTITMRRNFSILVPDSPELVALAEDLAAQWSPLGFTVTVEAAERGVYRQRLEAHDFDTAIVEYSFAPLADPDAFPFWHVGQYPNGLNYGGMRDLRVSEILEMARRETVGINRVELYHQFQQLFTSRGSALTLYHPLYVYLTDERLAGVQLGFVSTPADRFRTIQNWRWENIE